jgi:hypothetical protein
MERQYIYLSVNVSEVALGFERNNSGSKKLPTYIRKYKGLICLSKCHVSFKAAVINLGYVYPRGT